MRLRLDDELEGLTMPRGDFWPDWRERLASGYTVTANGCHEWNGSKNNKGYGVIWFDGRLHLAHRAAWLAAYGAFPAPGLVTDHVCENKGCVNVAHLRELTNAENIKRAYPRGDAATERRRALNNEAKKRYRARLAAKAGGPNPVV